MCTVLITTKVCVHRAGFLNNGAWSGRSMKNGTSICHFLLLQQSADVLGEVGATWLNILPSDIQHEQTIELPDQILVGNQEISPVICLDCVDRDQ